MTMSFILLEWGNMCGWYVLDHTYIEEVAIQFMCTYHPMMAHVNAHIFATCVNPIGGSIAR